MFGTCDTKRGRQTWRAAVALAVLAVVIVLGATSDAGAHARPAVVERAA